MRGLLCALLLLTACGGGGLNPDFAGIWRGTETVTVQGQAPFIVSANIDISVSGDQASIAQACPDSSGILTAKGSGNSASLAAGLTCPAPVAGCPSELLTYGSGSMALSQGALTANAAGTLSGCGSSSTVSIVYAATK